MAQVRITDVLTGRSKLVEERYGIATCGTCGRSWDDARITDITPVPSARCPFEDKHANAISYPVRRRRK